MSWRSCLLESLCSFIWMVTRYFSASGWVLIQVLLVSSLVVSAWPLVSRAGHDGVLGCPFCWNTDRILHRSNHTCVPLIIWWDMSWRSCLLVSLCYCIRCDTSLWWRSCLPESLCYFLRWDMPWCSCFIGQTIPVCRFMSVSVVSSAEHLVACPTEIGLPSTHKRHGKYIYIQKHNK
jgi:hypothetical protein